MSECWHEDLHMKESESLMSPINVDPPGFFLISIRLLGVSLNQLTTRLCALGKLRFDDTHSFQPHGTPGMPFISCFSVHSLHDSSTHDYTFSHGSQQKLISLHGCLADSHQLLNIILRCCVPRRLHPGCVFKRTCVAFIFGHSTKSFALLRNSCK